MPLYVNSSVILAETITSTDSFYAAYPKFKEHGQLLRSQPSKEIGPEELLYVNQREFAVVLPSDERISRLGSDDATTCHLAVLRHSDSGVVCLVHFDGAGVEEGIAQMLNKISTQSPAHHHGRLQLHVIGGFCDDRGTSEELSLLVFKCFHNQPMNIDLVTFCVGDANTVIREGIHRPIIYGICVIVRTGELFPATFPDKGPEISLRSVRQLTGGHQILDIYNTNEGLLNIEPFHYDPMPDAYLWPLQTDEFILKHCSTSPRVEPAHFVDQMRRTFKYLDQHPFPSLTIFPENKPLRFRKEPNGEWIRIP